MTRERLFIAPPGYEVNTPYAVTFPEGPIRLRDVSGDWSDFRPGIYHEYEIVIETDPTRGDWARVTTRSYEYYLHDSQGAELLAFHWAPGPDFPGPDHPHLHVTAPLTIATNRDGDTRMRRLDRMHIPTGRISLESVIRLLIDEFSIEPLSPNWSQRLANTEAIFRSTRTRV